MAKLTEAQVELLRKPNYGVLGALRPDGTAQLTTVWVDADDGHVLVNTAEGRYKEKYVRNDPRVTLYVRDEDDPYKWLAVTGEAELVSEGAEEHIDKLAKKYTGRDTYPWRKEGERRIIIRIEPKLVTAYQV
ncbi:MAG: PPOX class F420-dependent oxidoreductase [Gaiellaceae bacterium]